MTTIRMSHWRRGATEGAEFWISCKRLKLLRKAGRLQLIQNSAHSVARQCQCNIRILFLICKLKKISNSCRNTYKFTYIGHFFLQQLFKEGNYLRKYCIYVSYILEVLLNFIIKCSVSRQIHVKDYPWVKSQVNPPLGHISVALMWWARVQRTYSFISIPLDICCWHKIDIAHSHCCPHTLNLCIDLPHNGFQATIDFFFLIQTKNSVTPLCIVQSVNYIFYL